jgi:hypothetical protein
MERNENTGSIPEHPATLRDSEGDEVGPGTHPTEQPTTVAGGGLGPLEIAIEESERS